MNLVDLLIILALIIFTLRGVQVGFLRILSAYGSFVAGALLGIMAAPLAVKAINPTEAGTRAFIVILTVFGVATALSALGEFIGMRLLSLSSRFKLEKIDQALGATLSAALVLFAAWVFGSLLSAVPDSAAAREANRSYMLTRLNTSLPPAPPVIARLQNLIEASGFPDVFIGADPLPSAPVDPASTAEVAAAVRAAGNSTVKIEGSGCGGLVDGSGFVAGSGLVVTNAHVVAGVRRPYILDTAGRHQATVVVFNPDLDVAVLRASGLAGRPLRLETTEATRGTKAAVLGFPGGGAFRSDPAAVLMTTFATGRNIYNDGRITRRIYELQSRIEPGNSGGPVVAPDGRVLGVVFARARGNSGVGYALTGAQVAPILARATGAAAVPTGACAAE